MFAEENNAKLKNANDTLKKVHIADLKNAKEQFSLGFAESKNANQSYFV